jgi:tRNA A37 N6-isopentenylltransferase MiaA
MTKSIMIIGPNGAGKTKIAFELARRLGGEIVNLDRTYLYKHFPIVTGFQDTKQERGVKRHLYEILEPEEPSFSAADFAKLLIAKKNEIQERGMFSIAEGASTHYVPELIKLNRTQRLFDLIIGVRFPEGEDPSSKYRKRIGQAFDDGMVEELIGNMNLYEKSYLIKDCHAAVPTVDYLRGACTLEEAKQEILRRCLKYGDYQLSLFSGLEDVRWIEGGEVARAVETIVRLIQNDLVADLNKAATK